MAFQDFMHERNIYKERPDFRQIALDHPELRKYAIPNDRGKVHVDFTNPEALRIVTKILLKKDFNLLVEIPSGFLIPTVPQRLNYILWIEDLLKAFPIENKTIFGIDVGTGPCAIFSLLGAQKNAWKFISTDTSDEAIEWAEKNIKSNNLEPQIKVVKVSKDSILSEVLSSNDSCYDFCLCNPPFFDNIEEIRRKHHRVKETLPEITKESEILSDGGEVAFVKRMIEDSITYKDRVRLYTSMFGKKKSYLQILKELESVDDTNFTKTEFCQGNTVRWGIAWTFVKGIKFVELKKPKPPKPLKTKPPLTLQIPIKKETALHAVKNLSQKIKDILNDFEIQFRFVRLFERFAEMEITSEKNTWSNQRRKRRLLMQDKNKNVDVPASSSSEPPNKKVKMEPTESIPASSSSEPSNKKIKMEPTDSIETTSCVVTSFSNSDKTVIDSLPLQSSDLTQCQSSDKEASIAENKAASAHTADGSSIDKSKKCKAEEDNIESCKKAKLENESSNSSKCDSKSQIENDRFQRCSLLYATLKLIKCKSHISLEMNCPPDANRETMHQIFQLLKNKLVV